jgi:hypothetical protein
MGQFFGISTQQRADLSAVGKATKQSRAGSPVRPRSAHIWQKRFYDFNVWTEHKHIENLRYMHRNPVNRGLVGFSGTLGLEQFSGLCFRQNRAGGIYNDLLEAGVILTTYNLIFGSVLPSALGWFASHQSLLGHRSRHCYGINYTHGVSPCTRRNNELEIFWQSAPMSRADLSVIG